jgi:hypothetical protein
MRPSPRATGASSPSTTKEIRPAQTWATRTATSSRTTAATSTAATGTFDFRTVGNSIWIDSDGIYVDWSSTFGIDAVIVKGGPNANSYVYDTHGVEGYEDGGLAPPDNPNSEWVPTA